MVMFPAVKLLPLNTKLFGPATVFKQICPKAFSDVAFIEGATAPGIPKLNDPKFAIGVVTVLMPPLLSKLPPNDNHAVLFQRTIDVVEGLFIPLFVMEVYFKFISDASEGAAPVLEISHLYGVIFPIPAGNPVVLFGFDRINSTVQFVAFVLLAFIEAFAKSAALSETGKL